MRKKKKWKTTLQPQIDLSYWNSSKRLARESGFRSIKEDRQGRNCIEKISTRAGIRARASSREDSQNKAREIGQGKISWLIITFWSWICWLIESFKGCMLQRKKKRGISAKTHSSKKRYVKWVSCPLQSFFIFKIPSIFLFLTFKLSIWFQNWWMFARYFGVCRLQFADEIILVDESRDSVNRKQERWRKCETWEMVRGLRIQ